MGGMDPGSAREEAERLVATLLATARLAASGTGGGAGWGPLGGIVAGAFGHSSGPDPAAESSPGGFATGSAECCVCPVCRSIAALRDPSPEFAERLATGAGDLAAGVASLLRAMASAGSPPHSADQTPTAGGPASGMDDDDPSSDQVWRDATRTGHDSHPAPEPDAWSAATRATGVTDPAAAGTPVDAAGSAGSGAVTCHPAGRPVVPASRAPAGAVEDPAGDGA